MSESILLQKVYYMSGTGNSYMAALKLCKSAGADPGKTMVATHSANKTTLKSTRHSKIIAFSYPTHGFTLPWHMLRFILHFPRGKGGVLLINNRAGMKAGRLFTPGISGTALILPALILILKGYRIKGLIPLDTPSNWISIHPGLKSTVVRSIFKRRMNEIDNIWQRIKDNRNYYPLKFFIFLPLDIFLVPVSLGYIFFGRFILARTYFADNNCTGCGLCAAMCPVSAIKMIAGKPWWTHRCESCMRCSGICPEKSVNSSVPLMIIYTVLLISLSKMPFIGHTVSYTELYAGHIIGWLVYYLMVWILSFAFTWIFYLVLFGLNRIRLFNNILSFTTPMKYWRRYLAPGFREVAGRLSNRRQIP